MWEEYKRYFKDVPEGLWFKRKLYGWGWTPVRWQGWVVILVYIAGLLKISILFDRGPHEPENIMVSMILPIILLTAILFYICYKKGERPRWQWGLKK